LSAAQCRRWVIRVGLAAYRRLPLYPYKQTSLPCVGMSQMCQLRTHAPQQIALYSINSSASSKTDSEMVSPSA
jgi:hypothetical protein